MSKLVTVLDLGLDKIAAAIAKVGKEGDISFLAFENLDSTGVEKGVITDINKAVRDVSLLMDRLQRHLRKKIRNIFVTTKDVDIGVSLSRGMIPLSKTPREITKRDVQKCLENASLLQLPLERTVMEKLIKSFFIDGVDLSVKNPIGLYGIKLEAEAFIITANSSKIENIIKCIDHAGFLLNGIYLSGLASANSVLDEKEKEAGVLLLDIGDSLTEALIFKNKMLNDFRVIKKGADIIHSNKIHRDGNFSSVVVIGREALCDGMIEEVEKMFRVPARLGIVKNTGQNLNPQDAIIHTSTVGLIDRIAKEYKTSSMYKNPFRKTLRKIRDIYESYF